MAWSIVEEDGAFANTPKMRSFKRAIDSGLGDEVMVVDGKERLRQGLAAKAKLKLVIIGGWIPKAGTVDKYYITFELGIKFCSTMISRSSMNNEQRGLKSSGLVSAFPSPCPRSRPQE